MLKVSANQSATLKQLEYYIQCTIAEVPAELLHRVIENWRRRVEICGAILTKFECSLDFNITSVLYINIFQKF